MVLCLKARESRSLPGLLNSLSFHIPNLSVLYIVRNAVPQLVDGFFDGEFKQFFLMARGGAAR